MNFYMPVNLQIADNAVINSAAQMAAYGKRCLIVTGPSAAKRSGALDDVTRALDAQDISWQVYDQIKANPTVQSCLEAAEQAVAFGAEFIIGIGGGSPLDAAKVVAVAAANRGMDEKCLYGKQWKNPRLPLVLIGTTAGTGSEVTAVAVLTNEAGMKKSIRDDMLYADLALGDPKYTMSLPRSITVSTGIDAVTHCTESYFSKKANAVSRACALQGMELLLPPLQALAQGDTLSYEQRDNLYQGSIMAGLAISVTGTVFAHNVGYYFSENHGLPHGEACALFLPELLEHAEAAAAEYSAAYYRKLGITKDELIALTHTLLPLPEIKLTEDLIDSILPRWENNGSVNNTIGNITIADIKHILMTKFA